MEHADYLDIKDRAWERLRTFPGVHAVGVGRKVVEGLSTNEPAIVVFVTEKVRLDQLGPDQLIPSTFEGVKTDVVQMDQPRQLAGEPISAIVFPSFPAGTGGVVEVDADVEPVPEGWIVVVTVTSTDLAPIPPDDGIRRFYSLAATNGVKTLVQIAKELTRFSSKRAFTADISLLPTEIVISPKPGFSVEVQSHVLEIDRARYRGDYLRGGIRIQAFAAGTLGCLARTAPTAKDPGGAVVGVTNQHVVSGKEVLPTPLAAVASDDSSTIVLNISHPLIPSLVVVAFHDELGIYAVVIYPTGLDNTLDKVAKGLAGAINSSNVPSLGAPRDGSGNTPSVKAHQDASFLNVVRVIGGNFGGRYILSDAIGAVSDNHLIDFGASIAPLPIVVPPIVPDGKLVTFWGKVSQQPYGVYLHVTPGGTTPTFGLFVDPAGLSLTDVVQQFSTAINKLDPNVRGPVHAIATGPELAIHEAEEVECIVQPDIHIGQPTNAFVWPCSDRVGRVIDARLHVDAAIIQLDPGQRFKPHIEGIGPVDGVIAAALVLPGLPVRMRGFVSGLTVGEVIAVGVSGLTKMAGGNGVGVFRRFYKNAIVVESTMKDAGNGTFRPFILPGDSGSALVTGGAGPVQVVGLLFGGGGSTRALATPISEVVAAFPTLKLSFALAPGVDPQAVQIVPKQAIAFEAIDGGLAPASTGMEIAPAAFGWAAVTDRLAKAQDEVNATTVGRDYANVILRHFSEAQALVNTNRRVGTVWKRGGGPEIMNAFLEMVFRRDRCLPTEIHGTSLAACLVRLQRVLTRYASPAFSRDLITYTPQIARWSGMTYQELLASFRTAENG